MQVMGGGLRQLKMSATPHNMQSALERAQKTGELSTHIEGVLQISNPGSQGIKTEINGTTDKVASPAFKSCNSLQDSSSGTDCYAPNAVSIMPSAIQM